MACDNRFITALGATALLIVATSANPACDVLVRIESGLICGARRWDEYGDPYASFRGVPYAEQPVGKLRFKDLQPLESFDYILDATEEGPICPQNDVVFEKLMKPRGMSEACIYANIHTPINEEPQKSGRSILVVIHDGDFISGSGDSDLYGPEFLMTHGVIVITFNYRLNVFGFLSLDTPEIPGNQGLRDAITLLRWVQRNAGSFGGNPDDVTLLGLGSGATMAHLLTLTPNSKGLFKSAALISGTAIQTKYTVLPEFSKKAAKSLIQNLGINCTDPEEIHDQLIDMPLEKILNATEGIKFSPVIETSHSGVMTVIDKEPEELIKSGEGKDIPLLIGFSNAEMFAYTHYYEKENIVEAIEQNLTALVPHRLKHKLSEEDLEDIAKKIEARYFNGKISLERYLRYLTDYNYVYPGLKLAQWRAEVGGAAAFVYLSSQEAKHSVIKKAYGLHYVGSGHGDDMTYVFRANSVLPPGPAFPQNSEDEAMVEWMTGVIIRFMFCSHPSCNDRIGGYDVWPAATATEVDDLKYEVIRKPKTYYYTEVTQPQRDMIKYFDSIQPDM